MQAIALDRRLTTLLAIGLIGLAIVSYLAGHGSSLTAPRERVLTTSVAGVLLDVPSGWQRASTGPAIPGFSVTHQVLLAPSGDASHAGLLAGSLRSSESSPLPRALLARLRQLPGTAVVSLLEVQAYRYEHFTLPGFEPALAIYVVPNPGGDPIALACYATAQLASSMQTCQHIVATLRLAGQSQSYDLTPQPSYASRLRAAITSLDGVRGAMRSRMGGHLVPATVQRASARLAQAFADSARSLSRLETTLATGQAQSQLSGAVLRAHDAYVALASAAAARSEARFAAARAQVGQAENGVDHALEGFALLGYRPG